MFAGKVHHLRDLGLGYFIRVNAALADSVIMNVKHNAGCRLPILVEETFKNMNDELHGRVVVVENKHPIHARTLGLWLCLGNDRRAGTRVSAAFSLVPCHVRLPKRVTSRTGRFIVHG